MRSIRIDLGPAPIDAPSAIDNVRFAVVLLMGAATSAEAHIARTTGPGPEELAAAGPLLKVIKACHAFEAAVAAVQAALPDPKTMAAIDQAVAAVERFGAPAFVSTYPLSPAEAAQRLRDAPPRLSQADTAAFAAASRDLPQKGSPWPT